ncbi:unnamed protein product [Microthlaspi erraticum]|uniref:DUF223 domain-containing protein n=1 Tax=Microthlaspi erraticum TaxID=1685480 RepID=A0A6D2L5B9_9BRAS|nr:unnamed protein product [Microthlaspi erraticum]
MASAPVSFSELKAGRNSPSIVARLLRFWEAPSINVSRLNTFKHLLNNGAIYALSGFDVTRSNSHFKLCDSPVCIRFTDNTSFEEAPETNFSIPTEMFRFRNHDQLLALANTNSELPDIISEVTSIKTVLNEATNIPDRVMAHIRLAR